jgi:hypothetical protein
VLRGQRRYTLRRFKAAAEVHGAACSTGNEVALRVRPAFRQRSLAANERRMRSSPRKNLILYDEDPCSGRSYAGDGTNLIGVPSNFNEAVEPCSDLRDEAI